MLTTRFGECGLILHPDKTWIVYCNEIRKGGYPLTQFDFLGYTFRKRRVKRKSDNKLFMSFTPAVSKTTLNAMKDRIRKQRYGKKSEMSIDEIAQEFNPVIRGWINYYGHFNRSSLYPMCRYFNHTINRWARRRFKKLKRIGRATSWIETLYKHNPHLFAHWKIGMRGAIA